jgi:hypothetical protein
MRKTGTNGWIDWNASSALTRAVRLALVVVGVGLVMTVSAARAQEDEDDDKTFEEKIIEGVMHGIGATNMENQGINYRERSPLVVPPRIDLPPPAGTVEAKTPNWPKDPDEARRKAAIAERKKIKTPTVQDLNRPLLPSELNVAKGAPTSAANSDTAQPGNSNNPMMSPSELGFEGRFSNMFGGNKAQVAPFKGEPTRDSLTQPPPGYQTPSPSYAYGTGPAEQLNRKWDPVAGKYAE